MKRRPSILALLSLATAACTSTTATSPTPSVLVPPSSPPVATAPPKAPGFEVHEWGLVDVAANDASSTRVLAGPPGGPTNWNAPRRKPVVYFHLDDATPSIDATVRVIAPAAPGFVERFPAPDETSTSTELVWSGLHVRKGACKMRDLPTIGSPGCNTPDAQCETAELARYEADDASCIERAGGTYNHLFYRSAGPAPALPYDVKITGTSVTIEHARASDTIGPILFVHNDDGAASASVIATPALGDRVSASVPSGLDTEPARRALDDAMKSVGLTPAEIGAFDRAWTNDLFGSGPARELGPRRAAIGPRDYLLYALPASLADGAAKLAITPPPRAVKRFLLVRVYV